MELEGGQEVPRDVVHSHQPLSVVDKKRRLAKGSVEKQRPVSIAICGESVSPPRQSQNPKKEKLLLLSA